MVRSRSSLAGPRPARTPGRLLPSVHSSRATASVPPGQAPPPSTSKTSRQPIPSDHLSDSGHNSSATGADQPDSATLSQLNPATSDPPSPIHQPEDSRPTTPSGSKKQKTAKRRANSFPDHHKRRSRRRPAPQRSHTPIQRPRCRSPAPTSPARRQHGDQLRVIQPNLFRSADRERDVRPVEVVQQEWRQAEGHRAPPLPAIPPVTIRSSFRSTTPPAGRGSARRCENSLGQPYEILIAEAPATHAHLPRPPPSAPTYQVMTDKASTSSTSAPADADRSFRTSTFDPSPTAAPTFRANADPLTAPAAPRPSTTIQAPRVRNFVTFAHHFNGRPSA